MYSILISFATALAMVTAAPFHKRDGVLGLDVSNYDLDVDWNGAYAGGMRFVYIKATEGTTFLDPLFSTHYEGATSAGLLRGGYHYADGTGDGSEEAEFFLSNGGGWSDDGITLPGLLDLEGDCKDVDWIQTFSDTYYNATGRYPTLYSSPGWWQDCTGDSDAFSNTNALTMACWNSDECTPQGSWPYAAFWQYSDSNDYAGDSDSWDGSLEDLQKYARGC